MSRQPLLEARNPQTPDTLTSSELSLADVPELLGVRVFHVRIVLFGVLASTVPSSIMSTVPFVIHEIMEEFNVGKSVAVLVGSCILLGSIVGTLVIGSLSDRFGRKLTFACSFLLTIILGLLHLGIPHGPSGFNALLIARTGLGFCFGGMTTTILPYTLEFISDDWRGTVGGVVQLGWAFGSVLSILIAQAFQSNWRVVLSLPACTAVICSVALWFCPESPRWLFITGSEDEGYEVIKSIMSSAVLAGPEPERRNVPIIVVPPSALEPKQSRPLLEQLHDLFRPGVRRTTICCCLLFVLTAGSSYSTFLWMPMLLKDLSGDEGIHYELFIWADIASFLGGCAATVSMDTCGRKWSYIAGATISAMCKGSFPFVASYSSTTIGIYAIVIGNSFFITISWAAMMVYIAEAFPTSLRGTGGGTAGFCGRLSAAVLPIFVAMILEVSVYWAFAVVSATIFSGALVALLMSTETAHARLIDDVSQNGEAPDKA